MAKPHKTYDTAFKEKAIQLSKERQDQAALARELGIKPRLLYKWRRKQEEPMKVDQTGYTGDVDPSNGHVDPLEILVNKKRTMTILQFFSETIAF